MTDQTRSRRSSSSRVSPMQISPAKVAKLPAPAPADPEPSLGEVRFDEWFDTPVFESDPDERLEELAMSRRGPLRLAAGALLRVNARTAVTKRRTAPPAQDFYDAAVWADGTDDPWWPTGVAVPADEPVPAGEHAVADEPFLAVEAVTEEVPVTPAAPAGPAAKRQRASRAGSPAAASSSRTRTAGARSGSTRTRTAGARTGSTRSATAGNVPAARKGPAGKQPSTPVQPATAAEPPARRKTESLAPQSATAEPPARRKTESPPPRSAPAVGAPLTAAIPAAEPAHVRPGLRTRVSSALDRWAEKEARTQQRLERLMLPKRWQS